MRCIAAVRSSRLSACESSSAAASSSTEGCGAKSSSSRAVCCIQRSLAAAFAASVEDDEDDAPLLLSLISPARYAAKSSGLHCAMCAQKDVPRRNTSLLHEGQVSITAVAVGADEERIMLGSGL